MDACGELAKVLGSCGLYDLELGCDATISGGTGLCGLLVPNAGLIQHSGRGKLQLQMDLTSEPYHEPLASFIGR